MKIKKDIIKNLFEKEFYELKEGNKNLNKFVKLNPGFLKIMLNVFKLIEDKKEKTIEIEIEEFCLNFLGMTKTDIKNHRKILFKTLNDISNTNFLNNLEKLININLSKEKEGASKKRKMLINLNENYFNLNEDFIELNENLLRYQNGLKTYKIFNFLLFLNYELSTKRKILLNLNSVFEYLEYKSTFKINKKNLQKHLTKVKKLNYFKDYKFNQNELIVYKSDLKEIENLYKKNEKDIKIEDIKITEKKTILEKNLIKDKIKLTKKQIQLEKELNDIIFLHLKEKLKNEYQINQNYSFKFNNKRYEVDIALFNKNNPKDIIFIELKLTKDKRAPAQVLGYSGCYEQKEGLKLNSIKSIVVQNSFVLSDIGFINSVPNLYFYKYYIQDDFLFFTKNILS